MWEFLRTHALRSSFFLELAGGKNDAVSVIDVAGFNSEARGRAYAPPVDVSGATGLRWGFGEVFTGDCNTLAFEWDHNKPGGPTP